MKFTVQRNDLLHALTMAGKAIGKSVFPILDNYRICINDGMCLVTGSNMENFITKPLKIDTEIEKLDICINAVKLFNYIKGLPDQPISFEIENQIGIVHKDENSFLVTIKTPNGKCILPGEDGSFYPATPIVTDTLTHSVESMRLIDAIDKTLFTIDPNISKEGFKYALLSFGNGIILVGCNTTVMSVHRVFDNTINRKDALISKSSLEAVKSVNPKGMIDISYSDKNMLFCFEDGTILTCQLLDEIYPTYATAIPETDKKCIIESGQLLGALKRLCVFAEYGGHVLFELKGESMLLSCENIDYGESAIEEVNCANSGGYFKIKLNANNIIDFIGKLKTETISMSFLEKNKPCIVRKQESDDPFDLFLAMPIHLPN